MPPEPLSWLLASVSAAEPGSEPVTVPTARSDPSGSAVVSSAFSFTVTSLSFGATIPLSVRLIVSVVVEVSPSPSLMV